MPHFDLSSGEHYQAEAFELTPAARRHTETDDAEEAYILRSKLTPGKPNKQGVTTEWLRPAFALQIGAWVRKGTCSKAGLLLGRFFTGRALRVRSLSNLLQARCQTNLRLWYAGKPCLDPLVPIKDQPREITSNGWHCEKNYFILTGTFTLQVLLMMAVKLPCGESPPFIVFVTLHDLCPQVVGNVSWRS